MYSHAKTQKKTGKWVVCSNCHRTMTADEASCVAGSTHGSGGKNHCGGTFERTDERPADAW